MTTIREATTADTEALSRVEQAAALAFRSVPGLERIADGAPTSPEANRDLIANGIVLVAQDGGDILGFIAGQYEGRECHIAELSVALEAQRRGIGAALMHALEVAARRLHAEALTLTTFRDLAFNEHFYSRLGFERLDPQALNERLRAILRREAERGLPPERRCAMRKKLLA
jgi:N-acetylglutamate synthase-like GNAT family acetyltransferase